MYNNYLLFDINFFFFICILFKKCAITIETTRDRQLEYIDNQRHHSWRHVDENFANLVRNLKLWPVDEIGVYNNSET